MSSDRVVNWKKNKKPTPEEVKFVLEDFFNGQAKIEFKIDRYFIALSGHCRHPLIRVNDIVAKLENPTADPWERWIEVWEDEKKTCLHVMTRHQDEYVGSVANGLIEVFRRFWNGQLEPM